MDFKTIIIPNTLVKGIQKGWGNGYVLIPKGHKLHGIIYWDIEDMEDIEIHGGLTFSREVTEHTLSKIPQLTKDDIGSWMIGFDTAHCGDNEITCPKEYVEKETQYLLEQVKNL